MSSESWPPPLKEWVAKCLGQITDTNRSEVQAELKQVISDAFAARTLWTTDWPAMQLKSLLPKPAPVFNSLKRKSNDTNLVVTKKAKKAMQKHATPTYGTTPTDVNDQAALYRRAQRFQREHELERNKNIRNDLALVSRSTSPTDEPEGDPNVIDWDRFTIVGTSQELFKDYLRLTSEPKPETIRPYPILQKSLIELKERWKKKTPYNWICNQFKSLRQDLTVQRIKNEFTVQVYEIHARIALESVGRFYLPHYKYLTADRQTDMVEYNQCQATLKTLYDLGIPGKVEEFTAYRILNLLHGRNRSELNLFVGQLTPRQKADPAVQHALEVQRAQAMGNYHKFCDLYLTAPYMGAYIMDHFIDRERAKALMVITKSYRTISLGFLRNTLAFDTLEDTNMFLVTHSAAVFTNPSSPDIDKIVDCKTANQKLAQVFEDKYRKVLIKGAI